jgi:hypothetical protein
MHNEFSVPVTNVRKDDFIFTADGEWLKVWNAHYEYPWQGPRQWVIETLLPSERWPWNLYDTYGPQPNENRYERDDPEYVMPEECIERHVLLEDRVLIRTDKVELINSTNLLPYRWWVAVWEVGMGYGGPEEGGWWFNTGTLLQKVPCVNESVAGAVHSRLEKLWTPDSDVPVSSVIYRGGEYYVSIEMSEPASEFPAYTPHYS